MQKPTPVPRLSQDEIDAIAWKQNVFGAGGAVVFDYRLFAFELEQALSDLWGIALPRPQQ